MAYRIVQLELTAASRDPIALTPQEDGLALVARHDDQLVGFAMVQAQSGHLFTEAELQRICDERFTRAALACRIRRELGAGLASVERPARSLSVAICTKDRAARLERLLRSIETARVRCPFADLQVLVVDNAPSDDSTERAVAQFAWAERILEPKPGLDFARNAAVAAARGEYLAFLDDDVVVDRRYFEGLFEAVRERPDAGGFTGLVLPFRLETEAQVRFESGGGFGRGFAPADFRTERFGNALHPVGAGVLGAGCNMCFERRLLLELGGFDEALDTGAPLPGGGDLDIFYRVLRSGRPMVYAPAYAVYHEHRETLAQLERQYWTWGLGFMAFLVKSWRTDRTMRRRQAAMVWWWTLDRLGAVARAALRRRGREAAFAWAEFRGGVQGLLGEYDRSRERVRAIREQTA